MIPETLNPKSYTNRYSDHDWNENLISFQLNVVGSWRQPQCTMSFLSQRIKVLGALTCNLTRCKNWLNVRVLAGAVAFPRRGRQAVEVMAPRAFLVNIHIGVERVESRSEPRDHNHRRDRQQKPLVPLMSALHRPLNAGIEQILPANPSELRFHQNHKP